MATAKQRAKRQRPRNAGRWTRIFLVIAVLAAGFAWFFRGGLMEQAVAGASYGARVGCSCRYIGGRSLGDCRKDFEPGMALVRLSEDESAKSVTASVPLLASQTATYREGYGCVLQAWNH